MNIASQDNITTPRPQLNYKQDIPHIIKYMGSKKELLQFLVDAISEIYDGEQLCDLFAGTSILSGALGQSVSMHSNDIQEYSSVLAKTYLNDHNWNAFPNLIENVIDFAQDHVDNVRTLYPQLEFIYSSEMSLNEFNALERQQQQLINLNFEGIENHLFIKNYSGTYWTYEQCLWIDAIRASSQIYYGTTAYYPILSSLMFAMAYNAQSTGHYAQYRDATDDISMNDIIIYRAREIKPYFKKKLKELIEFTGPNKLNHTITSLDYRECLDTISAGTLVYADPPYAFVHYSRFYHALETLVKYDYPEVTHKGRYRKDRHQSPFCRRTEVVNAFEAMFEKIKHKNAKLILSYSNTGMISFEQILAIANNTLGGSHHIYSRNVNYTHSTMGRSEDKSRDVKEYLVIAKPYRTCL